MLRIAFTIFLALTAWIHPALAVSAFAEPPQENPTFINYEHHRKIAQSLRDEQIANERRGILQPEQHLQSGNNQSIQKLDETRRTQTSSNISDSQIKGQSQHSGRHYSKEEVIELIKEYSAQYGISAETPLCIAKLESGYNQFSKNPNSTASGVFQYISGTWKATDEGLAGLSVFDADANVRAAIKYMSIHKNTRPWVSTAKNCPTLKTIN